MKEFGKLENGVLISAPSTFITEEGKRIPNFNTSEVLMRKYGFKEVVRIEPEYDTNKQYLVIKNYSEDDITIKVYHEIIFFEETLEDKVIRLEKENEGIKSELEMQQAIINDLLMGSVLMGGIK